MAEKSGVAKRREDIRLQHFAAEDLWTGEGEKGWFSVPRSLPLVLALLSSKEISKKHDPSFVYLELLSRQRGEGVIEMAHEEEHAFAAGYVGTRAVRTWQERMKILEENGFIRTRQRQCNGSAIGKESTKIGGTLTSRINVKAKSPPLSSGRKRSPQQRR
jgi:hypothetical protein